MMRVLNLTLQSKAGLIALFLYSFILVPWSLVAIEGGRSSSDWQALPAILQVLWIAIYLLASYTYFRSIYLFTTAYLTVFILFHLGLFFQYAYGFVTIPYWDGEFGEWIYQAIWYATLAMAAFGLGFSLYCLTRRRIPAPGRVKMTPQVVYNLRRLRQMGTGLLVASTLFFTISVIQHGNILALSRFELFFTGDTRAIGVFMMIFPSAAIIYLISATTRAQRISGLMIAGFAFLMMLMSGSRSSAMFPALVGLIIWAKLGRRIPAYLLVGGVVFVFLVIPVIGQLRTAAYEDISFETLTKSTEHADMGAAVSEMGGTIGVLAHTLRIIPEEESYRYGLSYIRTLRELIPNLGSDVDADTTRAALYQEIARGKAGLFKLNPADWATYHIIPEDFLHGAGTGFSAVAEAYFNFSSPGVIFIFVLLGYFFGKFDCTPLATTYWALVFAALFMHHFLPLVRQEFAVFVKPSEFTLIIAYAWLLGLKFLPGTAVRRPVVANTLASPASPNK